MKRVLFVSNGHGESAIAGRIARELHGAGEAVESDHLPLVGLGGDDPALRPVGPRETMPSGGLVAMGNVANLARDVRAGFAALLARQIAFLRSEGGGYDAIVAVGDVYGLSLALVAGPPVIYVGTAKSVFVAPYGPVERAILRRARRIFVRDAQTAERLQAEGVPAEAPGNVIADLRADAVGAEGEPIVLLPGSRSQAYLDAVRLAAVVRAIGDRAGSARAVLSIAPALDPATAARLLAEDGWAVVPAAGAPFAARSRKADLTASREPAGALLQHARLVLGQAGTANELAASLGIPVIALGLDAGGREDWYRMRQRKLLGDAMRVVPSDPDAAAAAILTLFEDPGALATMRSAGLQRMGPPGGAGAIARAIAAAIAA
jgi:uncharacterized protein (TIGR03492 family)